MKGIHMTCPQHVQAMGRRRMVSVFRDITWRDSSPYGHRMSPIAELGDLELDLRHASTPAGPIAINAFAPFRNIDGMVPDNVHVEHGEFTLFWSKKVALEAPRRTSPER